ncbi:interaptin-like isoform X3 [Poecilia formosa]|uniref:interaptin-like isoform X3 n=1 Tax=Poecilia formosa TaxID=48698 RepID=UPI0007B9305B|nr:PREDICTED: interaptin-like isoform X3 [Poecilia formosa]
MSSLRFAEEEIEELNSDKGSMAWFQSFKEQKSGSLFETRDERRKTSLFESRDELRKARRELKQDDEEVNFFKQRMTQMETFYKEKLLYARFETAKREEELKSLKDSLAAQVAASLTTGDTESMNNPVSKTRLTEMYDNLKLLQWPKVKDQLKFRKRNPKEAKDLIQKTFGNASDEMKRRRQQIEKMFQLTESSSGPTPQKVKEYRQLTVQNLQMALFHTNKEELLKSGFPECLDEFQGEVKVHLRPLTSECYWLSCLMALNNPPLQPDWKNHVPGFDSWDIFPREIKPSVM